MGVVGPRTSGGTLTEELARIRNGTDSPDTVSPLKVQVARARTNPKFAGMFGNTQDPSGRTRVLRFSTLTMQFSFSCVWAETPAGNTTSRAAADSTSKNIRVTICDPKVRCIIVSSCRSRGHEFNYRANVRATRTAITANSTTSVNAATATENAQPLDG